MNFHAGGQGALDVLKFFLNVLNDLGRVGACDLCHHAGHSGVSVGATAGGVAVRTEFNTGNVFQANHLAVGGGFDDHFLVLFGIFKASAVAQRVLERIIIAFSDVTRGGFDVLFGENAGHIGGYEAVRGHFFGIEPDAHGIRSGEHLCITYTRHALHEGDEVDFRVVLNEVAAVFVLCVHEREHHEHGALSFLGEDTHARDFCGQDTGGFGDTVLDIDGGHVGISAHFEGDLDGGRTGIRSRRAHVVHVLDTVDGLLERGDHRVEHGLRIGTLIGCGNLNGGRGNVRILGDGQGDQAQEAEQDDENGDHRGQYRPIDE